MEKLLSHESWETIPTETYAEALEYARQTVDKVLKQESRVIWAAPLTKAEMQARFQLSEALKLKAAAKKRGGTSQGWPVCDASISQWEGAERIHEEWGAYLWSLPDKVLPPWRRKCVLVAMRARFCAKLDEFVVGAIRHVNATTRSSSRWRK